METPPTWPLPSVCSSSLNVQGICLWSKPPPCPSISSGWVKSWEDPRTTLAMSHPRPIVKDTKARSEPSKARKWETDSQAGQGNPGPLPVSPTAWRGCT